MDVRPLELRWRPQVDEEDLCRGEYVQKVIQVPGGNQLGFLLDFRYSFSCSRVDRFCRSLLPDPAMMEPNLWEISLIYSFVR